MLNKITYQYILKTPILLNFGKNMKWWNDQTLIDSLINNLQLLILYQYIIYNPFPTSLLIVGQINLLPVQR